jgi:hypothetical protein
MMRSINYFYYRIFFLFSKGEVKRDGAVLSVIIACMLVYLNLLTIIAILKMMRVIPFFILTKPSAITLMVILFIIGYFLFLKGKKYLEIEEQFKIESKKRRVTGNVVTLTYFIFSFVSLIIVCFSLR